MRYRFAIIAGKFIYWVSKFLKLGAGGTWPGEIVLTIYPNIIADFIKQLRQGTVIIAGTNGKTTTSSMLKKILEKKGWQVIHNFTGANLENGVISAFIQKANWQGILNADWAVLEIDENILGKMIFNLKHQATNKKTVIVLLNIFRDQLDRYGETDVIIEKWGKALRSLPDKTTLILNSDDPGVSWLGHKLQNDVGIKYFGLNEPTKFLKFKEHAADSVFCQNCGAKLNYAGVYYSHIGIWKCDKCSNARKEPDLWAWPSPLPGLYNAYNTLAAVLVCQSLNIDDSIINQALKEFKPAFGRQEEFVMKGKQVKIFLSKNPAGFNASLRTVLELKSKTILLLLNDRIPDGRDVSWIWDVDFEMIPKNCQIVVSGDRALDMGLRIKYSKNFQFPISNIQSISKIKNINNLSNIKIDSNVANAIEAGLKNINKGETLFILATYSAMLDVRKILAGRKIL